MRSPRGGYAFGDTPAASARLAVLAEVFAPTSTALLLGLGVHPARVLDLGCGPGRSTALLTGCFRGATVVGVDRSPAFVAEAASIVPEAGFHVADVADVVDGRLPGAPADLVYARFVLAHLPEQGAVLARWCGLVAPGGLLVVEETDEILTADPAFRAYLDLSTAAVAAHGGHLHAGPTLSAAAAATGLEVVRDAAVPLEATAGDAATMFALNLRTLREDPVARDRMTADELDALAARLEARRRDTDRRAVRWDVRQVVLRAAA